MKLLIAPEYAWVRVAVLGIASAWISRWRPSRSNSALLTGLLALQRLVTRHHPD